MSATLTWTQPELSAVQFILQNSKRMVQINFQKQPQCSNFKSSQLITED